MSYLATIERLSKSSALHIGDVDEYIKEVLRDSSEAIGCERTNVWRFNNDKTALELILAYNKGENSFSTGLSIGQEEIPRYFRMLKKNDIIYADNAITDKRYSELVNSYIVPNKITSMIDVPVRSEGKMIGVVCFEHVNSEISWSESDINFTQSIAQLISLNMETQKKWAYRKELEKLLEQKEVLLKEINHRVKNNLAIIVSLMNLQNSKSKDDFHSSLFNELKNKLYSISAVQNQLINSKNQNEINFGKYIEGLANNLISSYPQEKQITISFSLEKIILPINIAIPLGLMSNEILTNSLKYAFNNQNNSSCHIEISLIQKEDAIELTLKDNGTGYSISSVSKGLGIELIDDLAEQIDAIVERKTQSGVEVKIKFSI